MHSSEVVELISWKVLCISVEAYFSRKGVFIRVLSGFVKQKGVPGKSCHPSPHGLESSLQMSIRSLLHSASHFVVIRRL